MTYNVEVWQEDGLWCAKTPDKDIFRHIDLVHAIGEIFWRVNAAIQCVPPNLMDASVEEIGKFMLENAANYHVSITYRHLEEIASQTDPSHPLNLYESLVAGTR